MADMILKDRKQELLAHLRTIIDKKKCTIMVGARYTQNRGDRFVVCLSPNIMNKIPKLPTEYQGFPISYQELEPFTKYTKKIDAIF